MAKKISILAPDLAAGAGTRAYAIARGLQALGHEVKVLGFVFSDNIQLRAPSHLWVQYLRGSNYPQIISSVFNLLPEIDGDIIYAIGARPTSFGLALLRRLQTNKPIVLDLDRWELEKFGGDTYRYRPTPGQLAGDLLSSRGALRDPHHPLYLQWSEKLVGRADAITVNAKFLEYRYGGTYLPQGIDLDLFAPQKFNAEASRARFGLGECRVLLFSGIAGPDRGLEDVLIALERLNQSNLRLALIGGGGVESAYLETLSNHWPQWIVQLPPPPPEGMPELLAAADIAVVPFRDAPGAIAQFPLELVDAMAMAKPIIATTVGDIPEILQAGGFLVAPQSPEGIAVAIETIFQDYQEALSRGLKARQYCVEKYSLGNMASILEKVIGLLP